MIAFDNIPGSLRKPGKYFEFNLRMATRALPGILILIFATHWT